MKLFTLGILSSLAAVAAVSYQSHAKAAFINGRELFQGSVKDLSTWEEFQSQRITQSDGLMIVSAGDYTTRMVTVGVGQRVRVTEQVLVPNSSVTIYLTSNSRGDTSFTSQDSKYLYLSEIWFEDRGETEFSALVGGNGHATGRRIGTSLDASGKVHILEIAREAPNRAQFSVYDEYSQLLHSDRLTFSDIPHDLFISLTAGNGLFHSVEIIPEPAPVHLAVISTVMLCSARKRTVSDVVVA